MLTDFIRKSKEAIPTLFLPSRKLPKKVVSGRGYGEKGLPEFPRVRASGRTVEIFWDRYKVEVWGDEDTVFEAQSVAVEMEKELRVIEYVKSSIGGYFDDLFGELLDLDVPRKMAKSAIYDGCLSLLSTIKQLETNLQDVDPADQLR
jgi:hypothetical protein